MNFDIKFHATFRHEVEMGLCCPDTAIEDLEGEIGEAQGFNEIYDYKVEGGEITMFATFCVEIEFQSSPNGNHPYNCQADCRYCCAMDNWQDSMEKEIEIIKDDIQDELSDIESFIDLEYIDD